MFTNSFTSLMGTVKSTVEFTSSGQMKFANEITPSSDGKGLLEKMIKNSMYGAFAPKA